MKGVRSFLGLINWYRRFIPNVTELSALLVNLTKKDIKFEISEEVFKSITALKNALTADSLLIFPDFNQPFLLATDSSGTGIGAVLSQLRDGKERPIAYASRKMNKSEVSYTVTEQELLWSCFWCTYIPMLLILAKIHSNHGPPTSKMATHDEGSKFQTISMGANTGRIQFRSHT